MNIEQLYFPIAIAISYGLMYWYLTWSVGKTIDESFQGLSNTLDSFNNQLEPKITVEDLQKIDFIETHELQERLFGQYTNEPYDQLSKKDQKEHDTILKELKDNTRKYRKYKTEVGDKQYTVRYASWREKNKDLLELAK